VVREPKLRKSGIAALPPELMMPVFGCARARTASQNVEIQLSKLKAAGCDMLCFEKRAMNTPLQAHLVSVAR